MPEHLVVTLGRDCTVTHDSYHGLEIFMFLCTTWQSNCTTEGKLMIALENGLGKKKENNICFT